MPFVSDSFTDTANLALASHVGEVGATWAVHPSYASSAMLISNLGRLRQGTAALGGYLASGVPAGADYDVEADFVLVADNNGYVGICGRQNSSADTCYLARYNLAGTANVWQLFKIVAGASTQLGSDFSALISTSHCKLEMRGSAIKLYVDGTVQISATDSVITAAGLAGVRCSSSSGSGSNGVHLDNFTATDAGAPTTNVALTGVAATGALGSIGTSRSAQLSGIGVAGSLGTLGSARNVQVTGNAAAISLGMLTPSSASVFSVQLTGNSATAALGILAASTAVSLSGIAATAALGVFGAVSNVTLTGNAAAVALGTLTTSTVIITNVALTGIQATAAVGTLTVAARSIALTGNAAPALLGRLTPSISQVIAGNSATAAIGSLGIAFASGLVGIEASAQLGTLGIAFTSPLQGIAAITSVGVLGTTGAIVPNPNRIYHVIPENRVYVVNPENRTYVVTPEDRTYVVNPEDRRLKI